LDNRDLILIELGFRIVVFVSARATVFWFMSCQEVQTAPNLPPRSFYAVKQTVTVLSDCHSDIYRRDVLRYPQVAPIFECTHVLLYPKQTKLTFKSSAHPITGLSNETSIMFIGAVVRRNVVSCFPRSTGLANLIHMHPNASALCNLSLSPPPFPRSPLTKFSGLQTPSGRNWNSAFDPAIRGGNVKNIHISGKSGNGIELPNELIYLFTHVLSLRG
jgi:hypothetical protein